MLQITEQEVSATQAVYVLVGEITQDQADRLEQLVRSVLELSKELTLDVSDVWRVDRPMAEVMAQSWSRPGSKVHLIGVDQRLLAWLRSVATERP